MQNVRSRRAVGRVGGGGNAVRDGAAKNNYIDRSIKEKKRKVNYNIGYNKQEEKHT